MRNWAISLAVLTLSGGLLTNCGSDSSKKKKSDGIDLKPLAIEYRQDFAIAAGATPPTDNIALRQVAAEIKTLHSRIEIEVNKEQQPKLGTIKIWESPAKLDKLGDLHDFKVAWEAALSKRLKSDVYYNSESFNLFHGPLRNEINCYSGSLHLLRALILNGQIDNANDQLVMIFTPGHVLPGYIETDKDGDLQLVGIESTVTGRGEIRFGKTKKLASSVRVVDLGYGLAVEAFKYGIENLQDVAQKAVAITAKRYQIDLAKTGDKELGYRDIKNADPLNVSAFGFGSADVSPGRKQRNKMDKLSVPSGQSYTSDGVIVNSKTPSKLTTQEPPIDEDIVTLKTTLEKYIFRLNGVDVEYRSGNEREWQHYLSVVPVDIDNLRNGTIWSWSVDRKISGDDSKYLIFTYPEDPNHMSYIIRDGQAARPYWPY